MTFEDDECDVQVPHGHCCLADCGYVLLVDSDMERHARDDHELHEWVNATSWMTLVLVQVMETLEAYPHVRGEVDLAVMVLREEIEAEGRRN